MLLRSWVCDRCKAKSEHPLAPLKFTGYGPSPKIKPKFASEPIEFDFHLCHACKEVFWDFMNKVPTNA